MPEIQEQGAPAEKHQRNAEETRQRILAAAKTLFSRNSYKHVGTRDIAAAAEVNQALISRYFGSKRNLFTEMVQSLRPTPSPQATKLDTAREIITDLMSDSDDNPRKERLRLILFSAMDPEVSDTLTEFFTAHQRRGTSAIQGEEKNSKAFLVLSSILGLALGYHLLSEEGRAELNKPFIMDHSVKILEALYTE